MFGYQENSRESLKTMSNPEIPFKNSENQKKHVALLRAIDDGQKYPF